MAFVSQGDFLFPFTFAPYWLKHFYVWSYQTGASNLDGIMRLPSRLLNILIFGLTGNIGVSYFYIFSSLLLIFVSFYLFALHFLDIKDWRIRVLGAAFFALNPIFLGYIAKVGLLVGVAMLPLCLVVLRQAFLKRQFRYFILYILLLNVSLVHPFTLTINLGVSGIYFISMLRPYGKFLRQHKLKTIGVVVLGVALNLYFLLPVAAVGTINKAALSEEISTTTSSVDYTGLIDFANAGNPLTALSLSRDVLLDFRYYNFTYEPVYFGAVFVFYVILFGLYIYNEKRLGKLHRSRLVLLFGLFLLLILLSMATFFGFNVLIKMLVTLPGGWAFRSPLKWQLYIPLILATIMCILLAQTQVKRIRLLAMLGIASTLALMSIFLCVDIKRKLIAPKNFQYLGGLQAVDLHHKNVLFVSDAACFAFLQENLGVVTEMNQIFLSKETQLKRIKSADVGTINAGSYDYVLGCKEALVQPMQSQPAFQRFGVYADGQFELYQNKNVRPYIYSTDQVVSLPKQRNVGDKGAFIKQLTGKEFDFVTQADDKPVTTLYDPFEGLTAENVEDNKILAKVFPGQNTQTHLLVQPQGPLYNMVDGSRMTFQATPAAGFKKVNPGDYTLSGAMKNGLEFAYQDNVSKRPNLIPNPSLEQGLWQKNVWDCYAYDDQPRIGMALNTKQKVTGQNSLELEASNHIACSGPPMVTVKQTSRYLVSFRYLAGRGTAAGYGIGFDDLSHASQSDRLAGTGTWEYFIGEVEVPTGARHLQLTAHAYPGTSGVTSKVLYDDFSLIEIPDVQGKFYVATMPTTTLKAPAETTFASVNPSKKVVTVKGAQTPFYLAMRDSFNPKWQLGLPTTSLSPKPSTIPGNNHLKLNGFMNGWYINPAELCKNMPKGCTKLADGSYDIQLVAEFAPQRWFYAGLLASGLTAGGVVIYFAYVGLKWIKRGGDKRWRHR
ncbi:MAG TPA: hypothetical protein VK694_06100 [Verrucomicrobiae bacterium]|nr:hypothetical protein [Verrucomicrobiae bacterium]